MKTTIKIQNLKSGVCANTITAKLYQMEHVSNVSVDIEKGVVSFEYDSEQTLLNIKTALHKAGYSEEGDVNTLGTKAKSYVSRAIGKMS